MIPFLCRVSEQKQTEDEGNILYQLKNKRKRITEEAKSSAFKVLARPKSPASKTEILNQIIWRSTVVVFELEYEANQGEYPVL